MSINNRLMLVFSLLTVSVLISCAPKSSDSETTEDLSGTVMMGAVDGATVDLYHLNSDGSLGEKVDSVSSDSSGQYRFQNRHRFQGAKMIIAHGGSYTDEATGETVSMPSDFELASIVADINTESVASVNTLTAMIANRVRTASGGDITQARTQVQAQIATVFGLSDVEIQTTTPDDLTSDEGGRVAAQNRIQSRYGMILASLTEAGKDQGLTAQETLRLMQNMIEDFGDGKFDGTESGQALSNSLSVSPLQAMQGLGQAVQNFGNCERNRSRIGSSEFQFSFGQIPQ